ncbi:MAG TPA: HDOD domain-containing protein [Reyranella sp.]
MSPTPTAQTHNSTAGSDPVLDAVLELVASDGVRVPPIPSVVAKLSEALKNPNCELRQVAQLVGADQALSAHILRCASSSLMASRQQVTSLTDAVMRVGTNGLFSLSVSFSLGREVGRSSPLQSLRRDLFRKAAATAEFCRRLAPRHGADAEGAFLCGLLASFGLNVALGAIEQVLAAKKPTARRPAEAWMEIARRCAQESAASVAEQWGMPKLVSDVAEARRAGNADAGILPYVRLLELAEPLTDLFYREAAPGEEMIASTIDCSPGEAAEIAGFLPEIAGAVLALGEAADDFKLTQSIQIPVVETPPTTLKGDLVPASIPVTVERKSGDQQLVCTGLAADGFVAQGTQALPLNQVVKCKMLGLDEDFEVVAFVAAVSKDQGYRFEVKPMGLTGINARKWEKLRSASGQEFSANAVLDPKSLGQDPSRARLRRESVSGKGVADARGAGVTMHDKKSLAGRLTGWLRRS